MPDLRQRLTYALSATGSASSDFDLNKDVKTPDVRLTPAAVLVAIHAETETLILTKRSARLKHHPGQIAFPGGKQDPTDLTPTDAALREAHEEIGLPTSKIRDRFDPVPEAGEVSEVFEVPLAHVTDPAMFRIEGRHWQGRKRYYYTVPYGPYYIWGATARILRALAERMS